MGEAFRFGVFELDPIEAELRKAGRRVRLAPQPFAVLTYLVRNPGRLVSRDELIRHIWGDVVVDHDAGLKSCLKQVRRALGDASSSPRYVETIPSAASDSSRP